jgi:hypothetical protein
MSILTIAADEASETIGVALIDSITKLGGQNGAKDLATDMQRLADNTANVIAGITVVIDYFKQLDAAMPSWLKTTINFLERFQPLGAAKEALKILGDLGAKEKALEQQRKNNNSDRGNLARGAVIADTAAKKLLETNKKITGEKKKQSASDKLKAIFDMDLIQLEAAKKGKLSAEELARVNALIAIKTTGQADDLSALKALETAQQAAADAEIKRQNDILATHKKNAAEVLADNKTKAKEYADFVNTFTYPGGLFGGTALAPKGGNAAVAPIPEGDRVDVSLNTNLNTNMAVNTPDLIDAMTPRNATAPTAPNVTVNLQGGINIGSQYEFYESVWQAIENSNTYGNSLNRAGTG